MVKRRTSQKRNDSNQPKWKTLKHNGPLFPDPYKRLPKAIKLLHKGRRLGLSRNTEEGATLYAKFIYNNVTHSAESTRLQKNFFKDWKKMMTSKEIEKIIDLKKCDFEEIYQYLKEESVRKRKRNRSDTRILKKKKEQQKKYGFCIIDGEKQCVTNYKMEPPSIFKGRGKSPLLGRIKPRIQPRDVTINIGWNEKIPKPSTKGRWKNVIHDEQVIWLASWDDPITRKKKYIYPGASSDIKIANDIDKFEISRDLDLFINDIRRNYVRGCHAKSFYIKQRSLALFFIDKPTELNNYLCSINRDLTAKVFRTYNASKLFEKILFSKTKEVMIQDEKLLFLDKAYVAVAELCNHKKVISKSYKSGLRKLKQKIKSTEKEIKALKVKKKVEKNKSQM